MGLNLQKVVISMLLFTLVTSLFMVEVVNPFKEDWGVGTDHTIDSDLTDTESVLSLTTDLSGAIDDQEGDEDVPEDNIVSAGFKVIKLIQGSLKLPYDIIESGGEHFRIPQIAIRVAYAVLAVVIVFLIVGTFLPGSRRSG